MTKSTIKKIYKALGLIFITGLIFDGAVSQEVPFQFLNTERLSRYSENRVAYQHFEKEYSPFIDNSISMLLIIKDSKVYLIIDGYDDPDVVDELRFADAEMTTLEADFWPNKISGSPNYIRMAERRQELIHSTSQEFVTKNYGDLFTTMRDAFLKKQVAMFKALLISRKENNILIERTPIPRKISDSSPVKYKITVKAKGLENVLYYAEDADGDGITETFTASIADGFDWGYRTGPNIVNIQSNKQENIANIIGKIVSDAYNGSAEEQEIIRKSFPPEKVKDMIDDVYRSIDPNVKRLEGQN
ncbi:MAG: hypothetical protein LBT84_03850 [Spirochaetia bacterium]|jgi:hypothetical protein|nr:hypothetical protein [Spirochaetia bacterium]